MNPIYFFRALLRLFPVLLALAWPAAAQFGQITSPEQGRLVTGVTLVNAQQLSTSIKPNQVSSAQFQYSRDGVSWSLVGIASAPGALFDQTSPIDWGVAWDTTTLVPGDYHVRARFYLKNGLIFSTPSIQVTIHVPPVAVATATISSNSVAFFSGAASSVGDGFIVSWDWDFGDGTTGTGPTISHGYAPNNSYVAVLTVTDNRGMKVSDYLSVSTVGLPNIGQATNCVPTGIQVRGKYDSTTGRVKPDEAVALGPAGDQTRPWPIVRDRADGKNLGPLKHNPKNIEGGLKAAGYAFEIVADVNGDPGRCTEVQITAAQYETKESAFPTEADCKAVFPGVYKNLGGGRGTCTYNATWSGTTNDFDGDGDRTPDLNLTPEERCKKQGRFKDANGNDLDGTGGRWKNGKCISAGFPFSSNVSSPVYKPDEPDEREGNIAKKGGYRFPITDRLGRGVNPKVHLGRKIIWYDNVGSMKNATLQPEGVGAYVSFVAVIRGNDNPATYCYKRVTVQYQHGGQESLSEEAQDCTKDKTRVPGLNQP